MGRYVENFFKLSESTKLHLKSLGSPFPTAVGEIVYYRTYSRRKKDGSQEHWADTVIRVTEGILSVRKDYYLKHNLGWNDEEWQQFGFDFAKFMFNMKFLPPGRGLWAMGTEYMYERGSAALNNCGACTCKDMILGATWTMDMLMCGVGVGAAVDWDGKVIKPEKDRYVHHVIPDSREGWVNSFKHLLQAYIPDKEGKTRKFPKFDYSKIRKKGTPIRGFGGTASGPGPLKDLHFRTEWFLDTYIKYKDTHNPESVAELFKVFYQKGFYLGLEPGESSREIFEKQHKQIKYSRKIKYDKTRCCADIINAIGVCVVAGNVRRCIAKGSKVLTQHNSFKNIEDIKVGDKVLTDDGWKPVVNVFDQGVQHVLKVYHQDGYIECTPNHRFAVFNDIDGHYTWKNAHDLVEGDVLGFPIKTKMGKSTIIDNNNRASLPEFTYENPAHSTTCKDISIPSLDRKMAWLIGCFQGDGYVNLMKNTGEVNIAIHGDDITQVKLVKEQFKRFGVNINMTNPKTNDYSYKVRVSSKQLAMYFYQHIKQPKTTLRVPEFIKTAPNHIKAAFVQGLMDADGSVKTRPILVVTTIYEEYAKEIQALLLSMGIVTRYKFRPVPEKNWSNKHEIVLINKRDRRLFLALTKDIGFKKFDSEKRSNYSNRWPQNMITFDQNFPRPAGWRKKVAANAKWVPIDTLKDCFDIESRFVPVLVEKIVTNFETKPTYDIEVQDNHNFVCENVLVHNSAEILLGDPGDETFLNLKNNKRDPSRQDICWMSNNSVRLDQTWQFSEFIPGIAERIRNNGEPGVINLKNIQRYGRFGREAGLKGIIEDRATVSNPCVTGDTLILTTDGYKTASELVNEKFTAIVDGREYEAHWKGFWCNGNKAVYEVTIKSGASVKVTADHKLLDINARWKQTHELKVGDILMLHNSPGGLTFPAGLIISIEFLGYFYVYDCSIPGPNMYVTAGGFYNHNCGEIPLEPYELCNLAECFPSRCFKPRDPNSGPLDENDEYFDEDEFMKALEFATFYTSTVSLLPTQWEVTNKVIARNRRIGVSLSGIADVYDRIGQTHLTRLLRIGYSHVRSINEKLAQDAGVRSSIRVTTVKPSGSISQLAGVSSGMHFPTFKYAIRRIMVSETSPICKVLVENNVPHEKSVYTPGTLVFSFPIDQGKTRAATDVSMWEQFALLATLQREWSDNMVSCTIYFQPETEGPHIEHALAQFIPLIKSVSMLPHTENGVYAQAPYEGIDRDRYIELKRSIGTIDWSNYGGSDGEMPKYCTNGVCELPGK